MKRGSMHTEFPFPLSSDHQRDIYSAIFASTVFPAPAWHAWSPDFSLHRERAVITAREAQSLPICQQEMRVKEILRASGYFELH